MYFGYGLAYIFGIYLTELDVLGYGWRASYVIGAAPGIIIGILIFLTIRCVLFEFEVTFQKSKESRKLRRRKSVRRSLQAGGRQAVTT